MKPEESQARRLEASLTAEGFVASADGSGVHWHVDVARVNGRSLRVSCFWYAPAHAALLLGMNRANDRSELRVTCDAPPYEGPEFLINFHDARSRIVSGRTRVMPEVIACVRAWLSGSSVDDLIRSMPFVDEGPRLLRAAGGFLDPKIRWEIVEQAVWAYGDGRACALDGGSCRFFVGPAQVAFTLQSRDVPGHVAAWLLDCVPLAVLANRGVQLERHAEVLETDPARWHWLHVRDRIANPQDVLAPLAALIQRLASSPIASGYYTFSSLMFLRFSASSHYPFVCPDLAVASASDGEVYVNGVRCTLEEAVAIIESTLAAWSVEPFFGCSEDRECRLITESLSRRGSPLRPEMIQSGRWKQIWLGVSQRSCDMGGNILRSLGPGAEFSVVCVDADDLVEQALRFLQDGATFEELAVEFRTDPTVGLVGRSRRFVEREKLVSRSRTARVRR